MSGRIAFTPSQSKPASGPAYRARFPSPGNDDVTSVRLAAPNGSHRVFAPARDEDEPLSSEHGRRLPRRVPHRGHVSTARNVESCSIAHRPSATAGSHDTTQQQEHRPRGFRRSWSVPSLRSALYLPVRFSSMLTSTGPSQYTVFGRGWTRVIAWTWAERGRDGRIRRRLDLPASRRAVLVASHPRGHKPQVRSLSHTASHPPRRDRGRLALPPPLFPAAATEVGVFPSPVRARSGGAIFPPPTASTILAPSTFH